MENLSISVREKTNRYKGLTGEGQSKMKYVKFNILMYLGLE